MIQHKLFRSLSLSFCLIVLSSSILFAQPEATKQPTQVEPSYDVSLHLIVGSNDTNASAKSELPTALANISKQLKANFTFTNYRMSSTFLGRISNNGNFEYKSVGDLGGKNIDGMPQTFLEWTVANFRNMPTAKGQPGFQANAFRFGARVPVAVGMQRAEGGSSAPTFNWESIGLSLGKIGLAENTPTLIGTLNLPGADGVIFLVMTVKSADL